jgi:hypothetical protein
MFRSLVIGVGAITTAGGGAALAKYKMENFIKTSHISSQLESQKGTIAGKLEIKSGAWVHLTSYNADLLGTENSQKSSEKLASVWEPFSYLFCFDNLLVILVSLGIVGESIILFLLIYSIRSKGLKGTAEWLGSRLEIAFNTPVTFLHILYSFFLFGLIMLSHSIMVDIGDTLDIIGKQCLTNRDDLESVTDLLIKMNDCLSKQ